MSVKNIQKILSDASPHMVGDGFKVANYIPGPENFARETSPFLVLDYNAPWQVAPTDRRRGVGAHPHRGFETVTIVYEGDLEHRDSSGAGGKISAGDVQWMTAASGVVHEEFQTDAFTKEGGVQHMAQIWVNLPAAYKMSKPKYQSITDAGISRYQIDDKGSIVRVIAGDFKGVRGPATTFTPVDMYDIRLLAGADVTFELPVSHNTMLLVTKGKVMIGGEQEVAFKDFVLFGHEGETIQLKGLEDSDVLVLSGEPIDEPIASYGPFVMNTKEEIMQAMEDYNSGKFGKIEAA
jgi:redox-sensitive bicupin YhaK (pirin superfamily)